VFCQWFLDVFFSGFQLTGSSFFFHAYQGCKNSLGSGVAPKRVGAVFLWLPVSLSEVFTGPEGSWWL